MVVKQKPKLKMKRSLLASQERDDYCVCSVLQAILKGYGIDISQDEIASNLTPGENENGFLVYDERMRDFVEGKGLSYEFCWYNQTPLNDPDSVLLDMRDHSGFVGIGSHLYLFQNYRRSQVELRNPKDNEIVVYDINDMVREMSSLERGSFGLIKN